MYEFPNEWTDEISDISTLPEYQNATVTLIDPTQVVRGEFNIDEGVRGEATDDGSFWTGQARIISVRSGVNRLNEDTWNADNQVPVRAQFPRDVFQRIRKGFIMRVDSCPRNPVLEQYVYTVTFDLQGSNSASRTVHFGVSGDAAVSNA